MANVKRCDRCGRIYENDGEMYSLYVSKSINQHCGAYYFCPSCKDSFMRWMKKSKEPLRKEE